MDATEREFLERLRATFELEAADILTDLARDIIGLEDEAPNAKVALREAFRRAHSLKGAARAVGESGIEAACQALESVFAGLRDALETDLLDWPPESVWFDAPHLVLDLMAKVLQNPGDVSITAELSQAADRLHCLAAELAPEGATKPQDQTPKSAPTCSPGPKREARSLRINPERLSALLAGAEDMIPIGLSAKNQVASLLEMAKLAGRLKRSLAVLVTDSSAVRPELAEIASGLDRLEASASGFCRQAAKESRALNRLIASVGDNAKSALLLPFSNLLEIAPKLARDVARDQGKEVLVKIRGVRVMADRAVLDALRDPLIHLIRNAVDHGIESPEERLALGKPRQGLIVIETSRTESGLLHFCVFDDGRGLDPRALIQSALAKGLVSHDQALAMSDADAARLIFTPGFSTSSMVTEISGRGVGLDVVRDRIEKLGGVVTHSSEPGRGLSVVIRLPLALSAFRGVLVRAGARQFIMPSANVERIVRVEAASLRQIGGRPVLVLNETAIAIANLAALLGDAEQTRPAPDKTLTVLIVAAADRRLALIVDEALGETEARAKPFSGILRRAPHISGAALLGSGTMALTLDAAGLIRSEQTGANMAATKAATTAATKKSRKKSVLVVEDALTSRLVMQNLFSSAGYNTFTAVDGQDAWEKLLATDFDLVVTDVEMPRLSGFELTEKIRSDARLARLPVVLVTSLSSRADRERGAKAGANAYIVKGGFDQGNLLAVAAKCIAT